MLPESSTMKKILGSADVVVNNGVFVKVPGAECMLTGPSASTGANKAAHIDICFLLLLFMISTCLIYLSCIYVFSVTIQLCLLMLVIIIGLAGTHYLSVMGSQCRAGCIRPACSTSSYAEHLCVTRMCHLSITRHT